MFLLLACLLLSGCGWMDGSYRSVVPHQDQRETGRMDTISAANRQELMEALEELIASGTETATIHVPDYPADTLQEGLLYASWYARERYPIGAFAVTQIHCEVGSSAGRPAVAVTIEYRMDPTKIQYIRKVADMDEAENVVADVLDRYEASVVMLVEDYKERDFTQFVQNYAMEYPQKVMETPQITENTYGQGTSRVVELTFTYQNDREALRKMHAQVEPVFSAAALYVSGNGTDRQKYSQLYVFLMERFDYTIETSITPAYSLLCHGVGDSRAFATVYAAMCRAAGLECRIVAGTCSGEPRIWNMVQEDELSYHVDLLRCNQLGGYRVFTDRDMEGYVWDYSAYPACTGAAEQQAPEHDAGTEPTQEPEGTESSEEPVVPESTETTEPTQVPVETVPPETVPPETVPPEDTEPPQETDPEVIVEDSEKKA